MIRILVDLDGYLALLFIYLRRDDLAFASAPHRFTVPAPGEYQPFESAPGA